ncbi:MAG: AmmeMemoRadiSam system protein B, partial [Candidatus Riflebacteria bacterium]|nr:AmmeMemoRadiSam system protein B [Candidatus Riflebacteria bacterium]
HVIANETDKRILIIASSDFSHDTPREEAYRLDAQVIEKILQPDAKAFYDLVIDEGRSVCGVVPITALLLILTGLPIKAKLLKYATSMDVMRHERGVGYGAIIFEEHR